MTAFSNTLDFDGRSDGRSGDISRGDGGGTNIVRGGGGGGGIDSGFTTVPISKAQPPFRPSRSAAARLNV